jgi:hypothetical protein
MKKFILFVTVILFSFAALAQQKIAAEFPKANIAGKSGGDITVDEIIKAGTLQMANKDFTISEFSFTFMLAAGTNTINSPTDKMTPEMIAAVQRLAKGQKFVVEKIKAIRSDGSVNWLDAFTFTIK